ncbi:hypothetical protein Aspvir_009437 [Aspergillus viridinutans]|uniref:Uncharacterized protein n=1 Tax=Aspergillus viridinutans TaxID=75553 RepID=A0A9P3BYF7_ASPVI|nr:uncharacterized protein Aspvir_009437 [Aspergillus viridinutans]GIK05330.1 hypothetical protein Aspvir_009437 [Aspergillus viridinutans]
MISVVQDSEFMTNLLPANPVPAGKRFIGFQDQDSNPAVFSLGEDAVLNLIIAQDGTPSLVNFGSLCNFSGKVLAFDVQQHKDSSLSIVVATDAGKDLSNVYILINMMPAELLKPQPETILFAGNLFPVIYEIFLSNFTRRVGSTDFPMIFLTLAPPGAITKSSQLGYLNVATRDSGGFAFSLNTSWRLATDPIDILAVAFGTCPVGQGAFVLYTASDGNHLQFRTFAGGNFASEMNCPSGALCIDSYVNPTTTYTELLVGGDSITRFNYSQYCTGHGEGTPIVTGDTALGLKNMHVAQEDEDITIWFTTVKNGVHYYSAPLPSLTGGQLIQLLDDGSGGQISTMLIAKETTSDLLVDTVISVDSSGSLTLLQCGSDTGIWQAVPFYLPSDSNTMEVPSFTLRFKASSDDSNQPVQYCQLHIKCSGSVIAFCNGVSQIIDQQGRWYQADSFGAVSVIISTSDMASFTFQVNQFKSSGHSAVPVQAAVLNPNMKLNAKLTAINSGNDLLNAKTQTGDPLIVPRTVSQADADQAANIVSQLNKSQIFLGDPNLPLRKFSNKRKVYNPNNETPQFLAGRILGDKDEVTDFIKHVSFSSWYDPWGAFSWVYRKAQEATKWVLNKVGDAVSLIIELGGKVFNFLLDSPEAIGKAISWVFQKITVGLQKLIDFLGFLFNWRDILNTADSIVSVMDSALDYSQGQVDGLKAQEQQIIENLGDAVKKRISPVETPTGTELKDSKETLPMAAIKESVGYNWTSYQVAYAGVGTSGSIKDAPEAVSGATSKAGDKLGPSLPDLWSKLTDIFADVEHFVSDMGHDVSDLFKPGTTSTNIFERLTLKLMNAALRTTQEAVDTLLDALSAVLSCLRRLGNKSIQLPIFTSLWRTISGGRDFTALNAIALLIAIPATLLYKFVKGVAPPSLAGMDKNTFAAYVNGELGEEKELGIKRSDILRVLSVMLIVMEELEWNFKVISRFTKRLRSTTADTIDTAMIFLGTGQLIALWPIKGSQNTTLRYTSWGLDCANVVTLATGRFVGWQTGTPREETAPMVATVGVMTSIPTYLLGILIHTDADSGDPALLARHITEDTFAMLKAWLSGIQAVASDPETIATATTLGYICVGLKLLLKFVDFYLEAEDELNVNDAEPPHQCIDRGNLMANMNFSML